VLAALAAAVCSGPALAQPKHEPPAAKAGRTPVGLPVFSSDGKKIGKVIATGIDEDDQAVLIAEIERPFGIGADAVAIPTDLFVWKPNGIELTITAEQVRDRLTRAEREP